MTPNYSDNSPRNISISLWCSCRGGGQQEAQCEAFHRDFTHNTCLSESSTRTHATCTACSRLQFMKMKES